MSTATAEHIPTLAEIEASHAETGKLIAAFKARATSHLTIPGTQIELKHGERYAGPILNDDGSVNRYLILLPGEAESIEWADAIEWAKTLGGTLPDRREQSLLIANLKGEFQAAAYWSREQYSDDDAWYQNFDIGYQDYDYKKAELRARAVRSIQA